MSNSQEAPAGQPHVTVNVHVPAPQVSPLLLGKERNWIVVILLSVVTLGIYGFFYLYFSFDEVKRFGLVRNPAVAVTSGGAAVGFMFIPLFNFIWAIMLAFKFPGLLTKFNQILGRDGPAYGFLGFLHLIPIIGGLIVLAVVQTRLSDNWREQRALLASSKPGSAA